jgi:hypothetical protein
MKSIRCLLVAVVAVSVLASTSQAQEPPKPGPEHEMLKKLEGTWDASMNAGGMESKGTMVYKMDLAGLWLSSSFEVQFGEMKFSGRGFDGYDPAKKKFVTVWVDSMSTAPMTMEGTYDKDKKTLTMAGEGPGLDGKTTKYKIVTELKDNDNMVSTMHMGDSQAFVITYKRKK